MYNWHKLNLPGQMFFLIGVSSYVHYDEHMRGRLISDSLKHTSFSS
jgi:uncharacterized short protein YbdD (DUF466 family)